MYRSLEHPPYEFSLCCLIYFTTFTLTVFVMPLAATVSVTVPAFLAVNVPLFVMEAIDVFADFHERAADFTP